MIGLLPESLWSRVSQMTQHRNSDFFCLENTQEWNSQSRMPMAVQVLTFIQVQLQFLRLFRILAWQNKIRTADSISNSRIYLRRLIQTLYRGLGISEMGILL